MSKSHPDDAFRDRLLSGLLRVPETGCWEWQRSRNEKGYAQISRRNQRVLVHRAMYEEFIGPIPPGHVVRHVVCRNPRCANPRHLATGTTLENQADKVRDGMSLRASKHFNNRLSEKQVYEIRALAGKMTYREIGEKYGVTLQTAYQIIKRVRWTWLPEAS